MEPLTAIISVCLFVGFCWLVSIAVDSLASGTYEHTPYPHGRKYYHDEFNVALL